MTIKTERYITFENELKRTQYELKLTNRYRFYEKTWFNIKGKQSLNKPDIDIVTLLIKEKMKSYDDVESEAWKIMVLHQNIWVIDHALI